VTRRISPRTWDVALAAAVAVMSVVETALSSGVTGPRGLTALVAVAMSALIVWRRDHPVLVAVALAALAVIGAAFLVDPSELISTFIPLLVIAYSAGAYASPRAGVWTLVLVLAGIVTVALLDDTREAGNVYFPAVLSGFCWLGGRTVRTRARAAAALHEEAALADERREREAEEAVAEERRRIAREMHDVVAHSISVMVVQAGGARRILASDPARAEEAARRIRVAGTEALSEMQILLGVLETAPDGAATPTLDGLEELVERAHEAGLPATLEVTGERRPLSAGAELAVYRVVQEALTNAIKHAGGATTRVSLAWGADALAVTVADRGDGGPSPQLPGAGHGLMGMRERLRVFGGDVQAAPRDGGGWEVAARLPLERHAVSAS
jgi:signal transduction histidine kinase